MPILLIPALLAQAPLPAAHPQKSEVEKPILAYFRYHQTGDPQGLAEAFHPEALLQWSREGQRQVLTQKDWQATAARKLAEAKGPRPVVRCEIAWLEVSGDAAVAKILLDYPTFRFVDYMHLIRLKEGWKIVDKIYDRIDHPKP